MSDFNSQWIEIFKIGDYGDKGRYSQADLETMAANLKHWKPPLVIGHPEEHAPAHGWVEELRAENGVLKMRASQVTPELQALVKDGRFPNRSIAIYQDPKGSGPAVRHVGFLGAVPPEVKGLAPIEFSDGEFVAIDFTDSPKGEKEDEVDLKEVSKTVDERIRAFFSDVFGAKKGGAAFSEEEMDAKIAAMKKEMEGQMAEVSKQVTALAEENKQLKAGTATAAIAGAIGKVKTFIEARTAANQWVPAFAEARLDRALEYLATGETVKFSEGEGDKKKDVEFGRAEAYAALAGFLEKLPAIVPIGELAGATAQAAGNLIEFTPAKNIGLDPESVAINARAEQIAADLRKQDAKLSDLDAFREGLSRARREVHGAAKAGGIAAGKA